MNWDELFRFTLSPWELIIRGTLMYWLLFLLFRFGLRRDTGSMGLADILVVVVIADAAQNGMAGDYKSISEGAVLIFTIAAWNLLIDWMAFRYVWFRRFAEPDVVVLVRNGQILRGNLRREMLSIDDLRSQLRQQGVEDFRQVKQAAIEPDGTISVVRVEGGNQNSRPKERPKPL